ncbi:MAG TPA: hypothetical protein VHU86_10705 [Solirubrobacterales bacterium]|nr:hypothetical protein [Solirubrobacterales bacterium]
MLELVSQRFRRDMWRSVVADAVDEAGVEVEIFGPVQATAFGDLPELGSLNQIQGAAEPGAVAGGYLAEAVEWMRIREVDYRVPVADGRPEAAAAEAWLGSRGYECGNGWVKLVRDAAPPELPENPEIKIYELGEDDADGEGLSMIAAEAFDLPVTVGTLFFSLPQRQGWRCYTAAPASGGEVVSTGSMLIHEGIAQLGPGTTREDGRGRGFHTALLRRRLLDAAEAGCSLVFVELGEGDPDFLEATCRNLIRAGFEVAYESRNWQRPALHPPARTY